jgi:hypothetical protein
MATPDSDEQPIACTLTGGDFRERLAWFADLNRDALLAQRRNDLQLELAYRPEATARVREMVRREQECCAFLSFTLCEDADATRLTIVAPEAARDDADLLFEPFQSTSRIETSCACSATPAAKGAMSARCANTRGVGAIAAVTAAGALACAACCVLPFALPAVMLTSVGGLIAELAGASAWVGKLALIAVAGGWIWVGWQSARAKIMPARSTLYAMGLATLLLALAFGWPLYGARLLRMMASA